MNKFSFKLQSVLDIRQELEEQAKADFGVAMAKLLDEEGKLAFIVERKETYEGEHRRLISDKLNLLKINECKNAIDVLKEQEKEQKLAVARANNKVELARKKLNTAIIERKTMEKLREKAFDEYKVEYEAEERKQTDMLTSFVYGTERPE